MQQIAAQAKGVGFRDAFARFAGADVRKLDVAGRGAARPSCAETRAAFARDGFLKLPGAIGRDALELALRAVDRAVAEHSIKDLFAADYCRARAFDDPSAEKGTPGFASRRLQALPAAL